MKCFNMETIETNFKWYNNQRRLGPRYIFLKYKELISGKHKCLLILYNMQFLYLLIDCQKETLKCFNSCVYLNLLIYLLKLRCSVIYILQMRDAP